MDFSSYRISMMSISSAETKENSNDALTIEIERKAIDSFGCVGSLYNGCRDCRVGPLNVDHQAKLFQSCSTTMGEIICVNDDEPQNLLRLLRINEQLRLSILLRLAPSTGLASLVDYPHLTNEYTRLFCYSYTNQEQRLSEKIGDAERLINLSMCSTGATHIITGTQLGLDVVVILQLPSDADTVTQIDAVLNKLLTALLNVNIDCALTQDEENLLKTLVHTKVYTNTPHLNNLNTILDACRYIMQNISRTIGYPISYTLRPITWLYPQYSRSDVSYIPLSEELNDNVEDYVLQLTTDMKKVEIALIANASNSHEQLLCIRNQWSDVQNKFKNEIERLSNLMIEFRSGRAATSTIQEALNNSEQIAMRNTIDRLLQNLKDLEGHEHLFSDLNREPPQNLNVLEADISLADTGMTVEYNQQDQILGTTDGSYFNNPEQLRNLYPNLLKELDENFTNPVVNDQTSYSSSALVQTSTSSPVEGQIPIPPSEDIEMTTSPSPSLSMAADDTINILLVGETGVGKSTFINAFANYLTFDTLQEAQTAQPVVIIPVSFLITTGHHFTEHIVKFGNQDVLNNEDFDHPGQSVTQHCKSHIFHLHHNRAIKLRIIDTPGFGDTRGVNQDELNMQDILGYISTLSHINAVCFLLKPNESRLNICYRYCFNQLFSLLSPNDRSNIIFCFTNARSTFYTPGDTAPLLKRMLVGLSVNDVPFKKDNTFCFDNESFRYLVALQNQIQFHDLEKEEYEKSWTKSVTEAKRFIDYIFQRLSVP